MRAVAVIRLASLALGLAALAACASESHRTVETQSVESKGAPYSGPKAALAIGVFENRSPYMSGLFSDGVDRLGGQAKTILKTHLSETGRFVLVDRDNMAETAKEAQISGDAQSLIGAGYVLSGQVTEFGRRETGDRELFGILGRAKTQTAYSKVSLNVVDVKTSEVVYSVQGAGEYDLSDREVAGFGSTSGYDATLNGKVLNLSVMDAVNKLVAGMARGEWTPAARP
jgi:curli biogenesis system outer membrane secretion channel CsgG